jgi:hypothetical protein
MLVDHDLPSVLHAVITQKHHAVTIAKMITVGKYVLDARIIDATPAAAAWYGVEDPNALIGCWQSQVQHADDVWLGRVLSAARRRGIQVPTRYVSRIRQLRPPHAFTPVTKDTMQLTLGADIYWFTVLSEPTGPPLALQGDVWKRFDIPPDIFSSISSYMSVADMERALETGSMPLQTAPDSTAVPGSRPLDVALGETVVLAEGSYLHRCARCTGVWISSKRNPARCGKRTCQQPAWRELAEPFRTMQREGLPVTADMVLGARRERQTQRVTS